MNASVYAQNKSVVFRQAGEEGIIFNPDTADILVLNPTGCFIWKLCNGKHSQGQIAGLLADDFEVGYAQASKDLDSFLSFLAKKKFIQKAR